MDIARTVTTRHPIDRVFGYLSDFTTTTEWDPATIKTSRISGDGGVGTVYANTGMFNGKAMELLFTVTAFEPGRRISLQGENRGVHITDTMTFTPAQDGGTTVTYASHVTATGLTRLALPFLRKHFTKLFNEGAAGLQRALDNLQGESA